MSTGNGKTPEGAQDHELLLYLAQSAPMPVGLLAAYLLGLPNEHGETIIRITERYVKSILADSPQGKNGCKFGS